MEDTSHPQKSLNVGNSTTYRKTQQERVEETNRLLEYIKKHQPVSLWDLSKACGIPNSTLYYKIRDLEFAGVIYSNIIVNDKNRAVRLISAAKKPDEEFETHLRELGILKEPDKEEQNGKETG